MSWYLLAVIPVLGLLVLVHELGHFLAAKWAGVHVEEFSLGFPPTLVSICKRERGGWEVVWFGRTHEDLEFGSQNPFAVSSAEKKSALPTLYSLGLLPIGGFVRMLGQDGAIPDPADLEDADSFGVKPAIKRIVILLAGVVMNFLLAIVLLGIAYSVGEPVLVTTPTLGAIEPGSPAQAAGLRERDVVLSVDGHAVHTFDDMHTEIVSLTKNNPDGTVPVTIVALRNGKGPQYTAIVYTRKGIMGVNEAYTQVRTPVWLAPWQGIAATFDMMHRFLIVIGQMITGQQAVQLSGPVGVAQVTSEYAQLTPTLGLFPILSLTALLSINVAFFNILPFPALDGGRIVLVLIEVLRGGKRLKPEREGLINFVGFAFLLLLMVVVTVSDVMHL